MNKIKYWLIGVTAAAMLLSGCAERGISGASGEPSSGSEPANEIIGLDEAETAALSHAGIAAADAVFTETGYDRDSGKYEIEFTAGNYRYDYDISAADGSILVFSKKAVGSADITSDNSDISGGGSSAPTDASVTLEEAKAAALAHAGLDESDVTFTEAKLDTDDGREEYDIEFTAADNKYEYEINASDGAIISNSKESASNPASAVNTTSGRITLDEAKTAALDHAGLRSSEVTFTKTKLDTDDGREEYDIEFTAGGYEYEYEINAANGAIISNSKESVSMPASTVGTASGKITLDEAKTAALDHAGLKSSEVTFTKTKLDTDDGHEEYDIEFTAGGYEYEYEINAANGAIISNSREGVSKPVIAPSGRITLDEAKTAALDHAGLKSSEVTFTKTKLDTDDGHEEYDIEFKTETHKYEYEINAADGTVLSNSKKAVIKPVNTPSGRITLDEAKTAALDHAGLKSSEVTFTKTKLDTDDGQEEYDIEFTAGGYEYEYEINASNGAIISNSKESVVKPVVTPSGRITLDEAKTAALSHAGFKSSEVTFTKTKLDRDDGREVYEIEFYANGTEYEYTIDAGTGKIIESEIDD